VWAYGFATLKHIGENNPDENIYAYEHNKDVCEVIKATREHPIFFKWFQLPKNIELLSDYDDIIESVDLLILAIPAQSIRNAVSWFNQKLHSGITILNLAKWIDIQSNQTISHVLKDSLSPLDFNYAVLSWWMIAQELVEGKKLWADLWIEDVEIWEKIKNLFESENLDIKIQKDVVNIELYGSFKNIMAILVGYYEWKGEWFSTIWYYLASFVVELKELILLYWWSENIDFSYYSFGWDLVATCFWDSRNRYFWKLLGSWKPVWEALDILKRENKHSEWYETLKAVYKMVREREWFENIKFLCSVIGI
jgi:glycerol-3-phosphate dehydrogenase (NAD(P)+)